MQMVALDAVSCMGHAPVIIYERHNDVQAESLACRMLSNAPAA
jgi:hypothetical protein